MIESPDDSRRVPSEPASLDDWQRMVARELGVSPEQASGKLSRTTADGVEVQALYTEADIGIADPSGLPGVAPFTRGRKVPSARPSWILGRLVDDPRPAKANADLLHDLALGAQMLWLRLDRAGRLGLDADDTRAQGKVGCGGVRWGTQAEIGALLDGVEPRFVHLVLDAGAATPVAALMLFAWAKRRQIPVRELRGGFAFDPYAVLAEDGELTGGLDTAFGWAARLAHLCRAEAPGLRALAVSTRPLHDAGAGPAEQLGFGLAAAVAALRHLGRHGLDAASAASQLTFVHSVSNETFLEIARLRAARLLWSKVLKAAGAVAGAAQQSHIVFGSDATVTVVDPWVNILRATNQTFAAIVGGADAIFPGTFDRRLGTPSDLARRLALTTQHVLGEECHLRRVADPAGGSWALESLTDELARKAWQIFQQVEAEGGYEKLLVSGDLAARIGETAERRRRDIARRKECLVGLSVFPQLTEDRPERARPDLDAATVRAIAALEAGGRPKVTWSPEESLMETLAAAAEQGAALGALADTLWSDETTHCDALRPFRPSAGWERLRLATDAYLKVQGYRPRIFLANLGQASEHRARTEFAAGLFSAAGIEPIDIGRCEHAACCASCFRTTGARAAVLCSSDERYAELAADTARELKAAGASAVYLAGRPGENGDGWRQAGIDDYVFLGCDALEILQDLLLHLEVLR